MRKEVTVLSISKVVVELWDSTQGSGRGFKTQCNEDISRIHGLENWRH
jgi:hypothetical protein